MFKYVIAGILVLGLSAGGTRAADIELRTRYLSVGIDGRGYIETLRDVRTGRDYAPEGHASALLSLWRDSTVFAPVRACYRHDSDEISLFYDNGSEAVLKAEAKGEYLRLELRSLTPRNGVDNIAWGPYNTTISKYIGDVFSVVRDDEFAIGLVALDDNTTSGPPCDGEMAQASYIIHSPDPERFPVPDSLREGQRFRIGGDGINDVAFFSRPEAYYRYLLGNGAKLEPAFGSSITLHSRDRSLPKTIFFPEFNDFPSVKAPRHMELETVPGEDYIGSAVALYGCPDSEGLKTIERIVLAEGLPYVTRDGIWIRDPRSFCADIAWYGPQDSLISYARQLHVRGVQDEGMGEYYVDPADRWGGKQITYGGQRIPISEYTRMVRAAGIDYGLHTLTEFVQPHSSDVHPIPNRDLCTVLRTALTESAGPADTSLCVADTSWLNESGGWDDNRTNVLRIGDELLVYEGVTQTKPYTLRGVKRGAYGTEATSHPAGEEVVKLQVNCYSGFVPGLELQDRYADFYARWLTDGGMGYIDFDGYESCTYQGHGQYSFKRFMRRLFDRYSRMGGTYLRVMGSCVFEGTWLYMSVCNVGGGNHMFNPQTCEWGIEGKDIRYAFTSSYFPCTFGIQTLAPEWDVQTVENLQSQAVAWDATFMLGLSEAVVEKHPLKKELFRAFRTWEEARAAQVFPENLKKEMRKPGIRYHLERLDDRTWRLYRMIPGGRPVKYKTLKAA